MGCIKYLKRFDEIIRVGNLLDYGLAERFFKKILFDEVEESYIWGFMRFDDV